MGVVRKLRRFWSAEKLRELYGHQYDPHHWPEHSLRIQRTTEIAQRLIDEHGLKTCADLSAGDRSIPSGLRNLTSLNTADGNIEEDVVSLADVDLFICTETIEHLEAPWTVLEEIASRAKWLVLSTPIDEHPAVGNYEHYWSFTVQDIHDMLTQSLFRDLHCEILTRAEWTYTYQIWTARGISLL